MSLSTFITNLQNSDNNRKFRWLIGLTAITIALIIGVWMLASPNSSPTTSDLIRKDDQPTFFGKIAISTENVIQVLREKTANTIHFFSNKFSKTNTIEVETNDEVRATSNNGIETKN